MDVEARNMDIVALHGSRIPEMLGSFHLDDHNVQEWSDATQPGWKHKARKEVGKWVDPDKNADIKFQRREDSKLSDNSRERQRTEVIQGNAPDATFQIVRSQRQFQDSDNTSGGSRISTMSTSYQMSTTRGIRSTSKTTSNKTTTKTVTVSGGRSDDFETLKMSFQPLDTSTQRERINVSRSGTMGVRRPPTRRHTPAALLSSSPEELPGEAMMDEPLEQESDESMRISDYNRTSRDSTAGISIVGYKNISPKIRVGFPVEIQLELQSKLRYSNGEDETTTTGPHIIVPQEEETELEEPDTNVDIESIANPSSTTSAATSKTLLTSSSSSSSTTNNNLFSSSPLTKQVPSSSAASQPTMTGSVFRNNGGISNNITSSSSKLQQETTITTEAKKNNSSSVLIDANESADSLFPMPSKFEEHSSDLTFENNSQRRKSYGFESFAEENQTPVVEESSSTEESLSRHINNLNTSSTSNIYAKSSDASSPWYDRPSPVSSNLTRLSPSSLSRSWDLIQNVANAQQRREANKKLFSSSSTLDDLNQHNTAENSSDDSPNKSAPQKSVVILKPFEENDGDDFDISPESVSNNKNSTATSTTAHRYHHDYNLDSLEIFPESLRKFPNTFSKINNNNNNNNQPLRERSHNPYPPDVIHHNIDRDTTTAPPPEKSRKLIKLMDETPDLLNKMSFKNYFPSHNSELLEIQPLKKPEESSDDVNSEGESNIDHLNESLSRILNAGKDLKFISNNNNNNNNFSHRDNKEAVKKSSSQKQERNNSRPSSNYTTTTSYGRTESRTAQKTIRGDKLLASNSYADEDSNSKESKQQTQVSHTWISSLDQNKPSQRARDNDVTTTIAATNDPYKKAQKKVEFCKTEVHFTPDSGKFNIVEIDENKPSTVHLYRRKKKDKKSNNSSSTTATTSSSASTTTTSSASTLLSSSKETKRSTEISEKHDTAAAATTTTTQLQSHDNETQEKKLHNSSQNSKSNHNNVSSTTADINEDIEGLELVQESVVVDKVGVVDRNKNSLFDRRWTEQDAKPELGVDEETVTPTTASISTSSLSSSSGSSTRDHHHQQKYLSTTDEDEERMNMTTTLGLNESLLLSSLPTLKQRRDSKLIPNNNFDELIPNVSSSSSQSNLPPHVQSSSSNSHSSMSNLLNNNRPTLMNELLGDLGDDGEDADDCRAEMLLSNYGELKIQRFLKQLKSPSSRAGSESPTTDVLREFENYPDQQVDESLSHFRFDNVYENGSFVPLATRRSLIEMNNRNRKRGGSNNCHMSDNSSTTSNYSLPHSDRDSSQKGDYHQPLKLTLEATVDTTGVKPQITTVDLRYAFDKNNSNSYFGESSKRNFRISKPETESREGLYDEIIPAVKPEVRSLPPFNKNGRATIFTDSATLHPSKSPTEVPEDSSLLYRNPKPPVPILPSHFSSFEKTGAALRERFNAKNNIISGTNNERSEKRKKTSYASSDEPTYIPSTSIVNIGGDEDRLTSSMLNKVSIDSDNLTVSHDAPLRSQTEMESEMNEPILSMDHTWKGPAHFDSQPNGNNRGAPVMRSMTFPKSSRPEPEWVTKAKSRESRVTDWNLVGKQYGSSRKSEPPWVTEIRFKSKPPLPDEPNTIPKASNVYPWEMKAEKERVREIPVVRIQSPVENDPFQNRNTTDHNDSIEITELPDDDGSEIIVEPPTKPILHARKHFKPSSNNLSNGDTLNPHSRSSSGDRNPLYSRSSGDINPATSRSNGDLNSSRSNGDLNTLSSRSNGDLYTVNSRNNNGDVNTVSSRSNGDLNPIISRNHVDSSNRESNSVLIHPPQVRFEEDMNHYKDDEDDSNQYYSNHNNNNNKQMNSDYTTTNNANNNDSSAVDRKLLAPLTESTKRTSRKPLQSSSSMNKNSSGKQSPGGKPNAPPRPPKPPQRISSLGSKSQPLSVSTSERKTSSHQSNKHSKQIINDSDPDEPILTSRPNATPIHNHPLVKVAKIPIAKSMASKSPSPDGRGTVSKNKAKHHVVTSETKLMCKSKLVDGPKEKETESQMERSSHRPLPKVPVPRTATIASPHRKR